MANRCLIDKYAISEIPVSLYFPKIIQVKQNYDYTDANTGFIYNVTMKTPIMPHKTIRLIIENETCYVWIMGNPSCVSFGPLKKLTESASLLPSTLHIDELEFDINANNDASIVWTICNSTHVSLNEQVKEQAIHFVKQKYKLKSINT